MNADFINPFLESVVNVLETMAFIKTTPGKPYLRQREEAFQGDITGIVGFTGPVRGSFALSFSKSALLEVVTNMFGEDMEGVNREVQDAAGELSNMISGDARQRLEQNGYSFQASIPTVISGSQHDITHSIMGPSVVIPFITGSGNTFFVETIFEDE